jgi:TolB-like protein
MVATVSPWDEPIEPTILEPTLPRAALTSAATDPPTPAPGRRIGTLLVTGVAVSLALVGAFLFHGKLANNPHADATVNALPQSVAVLPFLDLTSQEMNEEYFADGMTEELIGKLSKVPGLRVPAPTSSFYFKGKQTTVADAAEALGVAYVVDGSVRKAGTTLRIAARLIRADNGFVVWSETYDRPLDDVLMVQNDIASEVTKALTVSINPSARPAATAP